MFFTLPISLTSIRLLIAPLILPILIIYGLPVQIAWITVSITGFFIIIALTDVLDGYFARKYGQESTLGKILDPLADKCLVYAAFIALVYIHLLTPYWVIIMLMRDFFVMGMRHYALEYNIMTRVSGIAKIKTWLQMITIVVLMLDSLPSPIIGYGLSYGLLISTILLSVLSAGHYYKKIFGRV